MGRKPEKVPGKQAYPLDPDINPWDPQPNEDPPQYARFKEYLDSDDRVMTKYSAGGAGQEPHRWSWGYRAYQYDLYMARVDEQENVRYRRLMNYRQRQAGRAAQAKAITWLKDHADPSKFTAREATRLLEVGVRMEREAAGAETQAGQPLDHDYDSAASLADTNPGLSLQDMLGADEVMAAQIANMIGELEQRQQGT